MLKKPTSEDNSALELNDDILFYCFMDKARVYYVAGISCFFSTVLRGRQGSYPFSDTNFQDFSRTQIDFSRTPIDFSRTPNEVQIKPFHSQDLNYSNSPYCLPHIYYNLSS